MAKSLPTFLLPVLLGVVPAAAQKASIDPAVLENLEWRNVGGAAMGGRVSDVEGVPGKPAVVYVAASSGGVWKTTDGGVRWEPLFDKESVASIGDIALEPGNPEVVYAGTGEANPRNSVSFGDGVYKSTDGGKTWRRLGLGASERISRIVVNPKNPEMVYVGVLGHIFGPHPERGVFVSKNGGESWEKALYVDDRHGVADLEIDPQNPNILYATLWRFERKPWTFASGSEQGGVFKSIDGGRSWKKLEKGLPRLMGRVGVKVAPSNPRLVYVIAESREGTLFRSEDHGETFTKVSESIGIVGRGFYFADLRVDPVDENRVYAVAGTTWVSIDGGRNFKRISRTTHADHHSLWIDPLDPHRIWQTNDGGVAVSYNRGETWEYVDNLPLAQFYQVFADNREPFYYVGGGMQDNATWNGPSRSREPFGILNVDWREISNGDGFHIVVHRENPEIFLSEFQGGRVVRTDMRTREQQVVSPQAAGGGPASDLKYRFNWNTPIVGSPHTPGTVYVGGNVVFKTGDFGTSWQIISPDLTTNDKEKQQVAGGPVWQENTTAEYHCTIISLAESPVAPGVIWAGTDDGNLQITRNGGASWENVIGNVRGLPPFSPVAHVEPSRRGPGVAYAAFDRHMLDDPRPYVFKTEDFGRSWVAASGDLPSRAYVWVLREDLRNPNLIYAGTELGLYGSYDGGGHWMRLHLKNLPTVAVHDLLVHPRDNDLIAGTHGRGLWIFDDAGPLQQLTLELLARSAHLFDPPRANRFAMKPTRYGIGDKLFRGPNPPYGALITYYLKEKPAKETPAKLEILDASGTVIREIKKLPAERGLNRAAWDLNYEGPRPRREPPADEEPAPGEEEMGGRRGPRAIPGVYQVRLSMGKETWQKPIKVRMDPSVPVTAADLKQQFDAAVELRDMQSMVNDALRALDSITAQIEERKKTATGQRKDLPEGFVKSLDSYVEQIKALEGRLTVPELKDRPPLGERPRLAENLASLFSMIDGVNGTPTAVQMERLSELRGEFRASVEAVNQHLAGAVRQINELLSTRELPPVVLPPPVETGSWR